MRPYVLPPDPPHLTLFYDREDTDWYKDKFAKLQGQDWDIVCGDILVAPEGVSAVGMLAADQLVWYQMTDTACPYVSLAINPGNTARELGPMVKRSAALNDWTHTQILGLAFSTSVGVYKISSHTVNKSTFEHVTLDREHGREYSDHDGVADMLDSLQDTLWSTSPTDVGSCDWVPPITFKTNTDCPIWIPQYPHKPLAEAPTQSQAY